MAVHGAGKALQTLRFTEARWAVRRERCPIRTSSSSSECSAKASLSEKSPTIAESSMRTIAPFEKAGTTPATDVAAILRSASSRMRNRTVRTAEDMDAFLSGLSHKGGWVKASGDGQFRLGVPSAEHHFRAYRRCRNGLTPRRGDG